MQNQQSTVYSQPGLLLSEAERQFWAEHKQEWEIRGHTLTAAGPTITVAFESINDSCGCMLIDDVQLIPAADAWFVPKGGKGGHRRQLQDFFSHSVAFEANCVWDEIDDRLREIDT